MGVVRRDDRRTLRAARRFAAQGRHPQRADLDDEHRRVHVERRRRAPTRPDLRFELVQRLSRRCPRSSGWSARDGGQYWNWYDHRTGEKLDYWPPNPSGTSSTGCRRSTTAGWPSACASSRTACRSCPAAPAALQGDGLRHLLRARAQPRALPHRRPGTRATPRAATTPTVSESRIVDYIGIARGQLPPKAYFQRWRTFPPTCDYSWLETKPVGEYRDLLRRASLRGRASVPRTRSSCPLGAAACSRR